MRKAVCQMRSEGVSQGRVLARVLAEDLKKVQGMQRPATIQASGTPTDVDSEPDYTWRGSDGDFM